jgi:hypothetical protein
MVSKNITENTTMSQATTTEELSQFKKDEKLVDEYFGPIGCLPPKSCVQRAILAQLLKAEERNKTLIKELDKWQNLVDGFFTQNQNVTSGPDVQRNVGERNLDSRIQRPSKMASMLRGSNDEM